ADEHAPGCSVERQPVAFVDLRAVDAERSVLDVDLDLLAPDHRALAHPPRDDGGVARHPAACCENGACGNDPVEILRRRLIAHENYVFSSLRPLLGGVRVEDRTAAGGTRTRRQSLAQ